VGWAIRSQATLLFRVVARSFTGPRRDPSARRRPGIRSCCEYPGITSEGRSGGHPPLHDPRREDHRGCWHRLLAPPQLGGPLSSILMGISSDRRFERVRKVTIELPERIGDVETDREAFVRSEDFEDLLIETLQRVAAERVRCPLRPAVRASAPGRAPLPYEHGSRSDPLRR
jgi:hypothetical protein